MQFVEGSYKRDFLQMSLTTSFPVRNFDNTSTFRVHSFLPKFSKFDLHLNNAARNSENAFWSLHKCIWIVYVKLTLLRRKYLSLVVNVLTDSTKILHITKRNFFQLNFFTVVNKDCEGAVVQISTVFGTVYHAACWRIL